MPGNLILFFLAFLCSSVFFASLQSIKTPATSLWRPIVSGLSLYGCLAFSTILMVKNTPEKGNGSVQDFSHLLLLEIAPLLLAFLITLVRSLWKQRLARKIVTLSLLGLSLIACDLSQRRQYSKGVVRDQSTDRDMCRFTVLTEDINPIVFTARYREQDYLICSSVSNGTNISIVKQNGRYFWDTDFHLLPFN